MGGIQFQSNFLIFQVVSKQIFNVIFITQPSLEVDQVMQLHHQIFERTVKFLNLKYISLFFAYNFAFIQNLAPLILNSLQGHWKIFFLLLGYHF